MKYPLSLSFKIMAMAPQIYVRDATGEIVCYVKQKMFRLKEVVSVFRDQNVVSTADAPAGRQWDPDCPRVRSQTKTNRKPTRRS